MKINGSAISTDKMLHKIVIQSAFQQTLGDELPFQQDNNLKHKAKSTLELLIKMTLNIPVAELQF
jgi:hypothetical protein